MHNNPNASFLQLPNRVTMRTVFLSSLPSSFAVMSLPPPVWSLSALLSRLSPHSGPSLSSATISHLLRLSALPAPADVNAERVMTDTLDKQLHLVNAVAAVDTTDVPPLRALIDDSQSARQENIIELHHPEIQDVLSRESYLGRAGRIMRNHSRKVPDYDLDPTIATNPLESANNTIDRFFVVRNQEPK